MIGRIAFDHGLSDQRCWQASQLILFYSKITLQVKPSRFRKLIAIICVFPSEESQEFFKLQLEQ